MIIYLYVKTHKISGLKYLGKAKSKEASSKSARSRTGLKKSEEFCKNVSARQKGVPKSEQHLQKMRAWRKTEEGKEIMQKAWEKRRAKKNTVSY
jgi:hypothetical protein